MNSKRRLDGKSKLVALTAQQAEDLRRYRIDNRIDSESELIRQAIVYYIDRDHSDSTLKLSSIKDLRDSLSELHDMVSVLFTYTHHMHRNLLAYHPEISPDYKDAAFSSAQQRIDRFFSSFQEWLRDDPSFFERLLHKYMTGSLG
jgi:dienelactone hydrolase